MLGRIATGLWGTFDTLDEFKKFIKLAVIFFFIIGVYWTLRPIKDSVFGSIVGGQFLPWAKMLSIVLIAPLVVFYSKLIEIYAREKLFYGILIFYAAITALFAFLFTHPVIEHAFMHKEFVVAGPLCLVGWLWYVFVESFGSFVIAIFWVIVTDITMPESAKRGFPIIALFGQMGNIVGPFFLNTRMLGLATSAPIVGFCSLLMLCTLLLLKYFMSSTPKSLLRGYHENRADVAQNKDAGFFEGLRLLCTKQYLLGIFFIVGFYELIITVIDNHFKQTVCETFASEGMRSAYLSSYAYSVGIVATICILFGINNIQRKLGMQISLVLLPVLLGAAILCTALYPSSLTVAFYVMVLTKAINYALNQPALKQLYIPTTKDVRYQAQGWIDMFGSRCAKGIASIFNILRGGRLLGVESFLMGVCVASFGCIVLWLRVAVFVSEKYDVAISKDEVVC
ncbi:MAG TPA: Npt1/Npt2 family nucleotide transporter [Candidatus Babeliales bacterium]|nr:Npt1/Npt2 family nucleotide transporter [Candidatus Babeliales bacterium]